MLKSIFVGVSTATLCVALPLGCTVILDFPEPVTAYRWCLDAKPAAGIRDSDLLLQNIQDSAGNWMRGCICYCPAEHDIMVKGANGQLAPGSAHEAFYSNEVAQLQAKAQTACIDRVLELQAANATVYTFDDPGTISCADAVADEDPYYSTQCVLDDDICPAGAGGSGDDGFPAPTGGEMESSGPDTADETADGTMGGSMIYGLDDWSQVISCTAPNRCDVDAVFVDMLLEDLSLLTHDDIRIRPASVSDQGHRGFLLASIGSESFPAALGLQPGDLLWAVNTIPLEDFAAVAQAFEDLSQAAHITVQIDRDGQTISHTIRIATAP